MATKHVILVTGATGSQGGALASKLLHNSHFTVRVFVRNGESEVVKQLAAKGAEVAVGDLGDVASIERALAGVYGVFSVQSALGNEKANAFNLIDASKKLGISVFVQSTVASVGKHTTFPKWESGYWNTEYWLVKFAIEEKLKQEGFPYYAILHPGMFLEDLLPPKVGFFYPDLLSKGEFVSSFLPTTRIHYVSVQDIASFAIAVFEDPVRFNRKTIGLASDYLTEPELARILTEETGRNFKSISLTPDEHLARGVSLFLIRAEELGNEVGYDIDIDEVKSYGVKLLGVRGFVQEYKQILVVPY